jgi:2-keto-4-pentenoate hydratase
MTPLATLLLDAFRTHQRVSPDAPLVPADRDAAYRVQQEIVQELHSPVVAWKVGTAPPPGDVLGSPIPACCVQQGPGQARLAAHAICGVELEMAFRFKRGFPPRNEPYGDAEVLQALEAMAPALEIVSSRLQGWPDLPDFLKLADLQNHGALVVGEALPYDPGFPFLSPQLQLSVNGVAHEKSPTGNPAGDPRTLLAPLVRQCAARGLPVEAGHWVTTGSYSGIYFVTHPGLVVGHFAGLPEVRLTLA